MGEREWFECCRSIRLDLLDLYGSLYVVENVIAEYNNRMEKRLFYCYTTDMLKAIVEIFGAGVNSRFADFYEEEDTRTGDEIALDIIRRAGLKGKQDECI